MQAIGISAVGCTDQPHFLSCASVCSRTMCIHVLRLHVQGQSLNWCACTNIYIQHIHTTTAQNQLEFMEEKNSIILYTLKITQSHTLPIFLEYLPMHHYWIRKRMSGCSAGMMSQTCSLWEPFGGLRFDSCS